MGASDLLSTDNPVFRSFAVLSGILVLKIFVTAILTSRQRFAKGVFANAEDAKFNKSHKVIANDPDVERIRRAHLNDLENIPVFFVTAFLYVLTNPAPFLAVYLFRIFTIARVAHTIVYAVVPMPQPTRAICYTVGVVITVYMALQVIMHFM